MCTKLLFRCGVLLLSFVLQPSISADITLGPPSISATQAVNGMWSNENAILFVWLYGESSQCPETRRNAKSVITFTPGIRLKDGEFLYAIPQELVICMHAAWDQTITMCKSGTVRVQYFEREHEFRGDYDLTFDDGTMKKGLFRAQYCPVGK